MKFTDRVVWITGASSGIGESLARDFFARGATVVISSNEDAELERVARGLGDNQRVMVLPLDLSDLPSLEGKARQVLDRFGRVDVLVNNGGISQRSLVKDTTLAAYQRIIDIDFLSHVAITRAALPGMIERQDGHIVVTSSVAGKIGAPLRSGYSAAKHALHGFFDTLRAEVFADNIKVTIVCPTAVRTNISMNAMDAKGDKYGKMSDHLDQGQTADQAAAIIMDAIIKEKEEVIVGNDKLKLAVYIKRFLPGLFSRILRKTEIN